MKDLQAERARVLGLLSGITQGNWERVGEDICAGYEYKDGKHSAEWIAELCDPANFGDALDDGWRAYSPTNDANAALVCAAPDLARAYAEALGELARLREALKACAGELAGGGMTKRGLTDALELARAALASVPEERP